MYNAAYCLVQESKATGDRSKAGDAEKMLKSVLIQNSKLNGPDTVARYKVLLAKRFRLPGRVRPRRRLPLKQVLAASNPASAAH